MNDHELVRRADRAKQLLEHDLFNEAWTAYRAVMLDLMATAKTDAETLEAKRMLRAAESARSHIERIIAEGTVAAADIKAESERKSAPSWLGLLK